MSDVKALEHPTLKVPYEILNKKYRLNQKNLDRELSQIHQVASNIETTISSKEAVDSKNISKLLGGMVERLQVLKRKAEEGIADEIHTANICKRRLDHLKENTNLVPADDASVGLLNKWKRTRMDRMIVEYFLRNGYYKAALTLVEKENLTDLTNIDIFLTAREVEESLARHETSKCLNWCYDNRSKLRKLKSTMEFNLRLQEFIELIRVDRRIEAIKHARKYFPSFEEEHLPTIMTAMALLAFDTKTEISSYKAMFEMDRWDMLMTEFRNDNFRLFQLANQSVFSVALQAGLSCLKTPQCYSQSAENRHPNCPVCQQYLNQLAENLPFAHCSQSRLYCHISGAPMNENNPPMMLPNGYVYGEQALRQMAQENSGQITCPKTKEQFQYKKLDKVFVM